MISHMAHFLSTSIYSLLNPAFPLAKKKKKTKKPQEKTIHLQIYKYTSSLFMAKRGNHCRNFYTLRTERKKLNIKSWGKKSSRY